jgi:euchromatic histone-lysine N-methyltransferase
MTPLHLAAQVGAVECLQHIVQSGGVNVNIKDDGGWTPMIWAAEHRHIECVRFLLDVGSDPNLRDNVSIRLISPVGIKVALIKF